MEQITNEPEATEFVKKFLDNECACDECKRMCKDRPCWGTPDEIKALIDAGYGNRLNLDWWVGDGYDGGDILILSPANKGHEGDQAPRYTGGLFFLYAPSPFKQCVMLTDDGLCELHDPGLKPMEGRKATCKDYTEGLHGAIAGMWNNEKAQKLALGWCKEHKVDPNPSDWDNYDDDWDEDD